MQEDGVCDGNFSDVEASVSIQNEQITLPPQLSAIEKTKDKIIVKIEKDVNGALLEMKKKPHYGKNWTKTEYDRCTTNATV